MRFKKKPIHIGKTQVKYDRLIKKFYYFHSMDLELIGPLDFKDANIPEFVEMQKLRYVNDELGFGGAGFHDIFWHRRSAF